jgi:predicted aldo/keto reductase-like oxidoreductase
VRAASQASREHPCRVLGVIARESTTSSRLDAEIRSGEGTPGQWRGLLEGSLKKLNRDYIDFYHFWGISLDGFRKNIGGSKGLIHSAIRAKEEGLIKHISFSYHDTGNNMIPIIDSGYFESVLCQYNLLDRANEKAIAHARQKGLGVAVMGPVGGGRLGSPSEVIRGMLKKDIRSTAEMALRFVLANNNVDMALSGMQTMEMVEENAKVAAIEGMLTRAELEQIDRMLEENKRLAELYCTGCEYCMPCPQNVDIPGCFHDYNNLEVDGFYGKMKHLGFKSGMTGGKGTGANKCIICGKCKIHCPQGIDIPAELKVVNKKLEGFLYNTITKVMRK